MCPLVVQEDKEAKRRQRNGHHREGCPQASPCPALSRAEMEGSVRKQLHRNHCLSKRNPFLPSLEALEVLQVLFVFQKQWITSAFWAAFH